MSLGNAKAIGDWFRGTRYSKNRIDEFFIKDSSGLTSFALTYHGHPNEEVTIEGQTSGEVYVFKLPSSGVSTQLQFFEMGETVNISTDFGFSTTKILTNTTDDIKMLNPLITLIGKMDPSQISSTWKDFPYTLPSDGIYMIIGGYMGGNVNHQYVVPENREIYFNNKQIENDVFVTIGKFKAGDVITVRQINNSGSYNNFLGHAVLKLDDIFIDSETRISTSVSIQDNTLNYTVPSDGNKHIIIGYVRGHSSIADGTNISTKHGETYIKGMTGYQIVLSVYYGDGSNLPVITMQGWNWGYCTIADIIV